MLKFYSYGDKKHENIFAGRYCFGNSTICIGTTSLPI